MTPTAALAEELRNRYDHEPPRRPFDQRFLWAISGWLKLYAKAGGLSGEGLRATRDLVDVVVWR